jgi:sterol desaturase/sphingolipid hydroxylase (fatty acid hydroxylase superfamily)
MLNKKYVILLTVWFLILLILETFFKRRSTFENSLKRILINFSFFTIGSVLVKFSIGALFISLLTSKTQTNLMPIWLQFLLLDLVIYIWHKMNHRFKILWRFHRVHHCDDELDTSTALRFHFGELILSAIFRLPILYFLPINLSTVLVFDLFVTTSALFHHSNINIPFSLEKWLNLVIVTPRMHEYHHSIVPSEHHSNFSAILSVWDRIFKTNCKIVDKNTITIGLTDQNKLYSSKLFFGLKLPFV